LQSPRIPAQQILHTPAAARQHRAFRRNCHVSPPWVPQVCSERPSDGERGEPQNVFHISSYPFTILRLIAHQQPVLLQILMPPDFRDRHLHDRNGRLSPGALDCHSSPKTGVVRDPCPLWNSILATQIPGSQHRISRLAERAIRSPFRNSIVPVSPK
jgi:hypothetical protein